MTAYICDTSSSDEETAEVNTCKEVPLEQRPLTANKNPIATWV